MLGFACVALARSTRWLSVPSCFDQLVRDLAVQLLGLYRKYLSSRTGRACMFSESCSEFAVRMLNEHGWVEGSRRMRDRLVRCGGNYTLCTDVGGNTTLIFPDGVSFPAEALSCELLGCDRTKTVQKL